MNKKTAFKKASYFVGVAAAGIVVGISLQFAKAWTEPTVAPPGANVGAPINTSSNPQSKSGALNVARLQFAGVGGNSGVGGDYYSIYQESGGWSYPYPDLVVQNHTGIKYDAYYGYNGHRFYTGYDGSGNPTGLTFSVGDGDQNVRVTNNLYTGGILQTPFIYDANNTGYYLDPNGSSQVSALFANNWLRPQGNTGIYFQDHGGGLNMEDNTWIRTYGVGNFYAYGESQATTVRANSTLCIGGDCRSSWPSGLQLNTWQGNHYSGSDGAEYGVIFYDTNNSGYYVDPSNTSRMNYGSYNNLYSSGYVQASIFYDANDTGYYLDLNGTSKLRTSYTDNSYINSNLYFSDGSRLYTANPRQDSCYTASGVNDNTCAVGYYMAGLRYSYPANYKDQFNAYCCRFN